jgi:mono/diheme cytochrome c family protein
LGAALSILFVGCRSADADEETGRVTTNAVSFRPLPEGVTPEQVAQGRLIFRGKGGCYSCHGKNGGGTFFAPALNDDRRIHLTNASYEEIIARIRAGVPQPKEHRVPMPPLGGAALDDSELRAVAAFVFSIDRGHP